MAETTRHPIERKRGDTKRIVFQLQNKDKTPFDISSWTEFTLTVDPDQAPVDDTTKLMEVTGFIIPPGTDGKVAFTPPDILDAGRYYYDAQGLDDNLEKFTFAEGPYILTQDITKL